MRMIPDPLLETSGSIDSLTLERAEFRRKFLSWKEGTRRFIARYSWNAVGQLVSKEEEGEVLLYAYNEDGLQTACYRLDSSGKVTGREIFEWDDRSRLNRRIVKNLDPPAEQIWNYEHDDAGRMTAEKRGSQVKVEKRDKEGRLIQEYLYDGERPDLVTEYRYDDKGRLAEVVIKDPSGTVHRQTVYDYDSLHRLASEKTRDSKGRFIKDEEFAYGAAHGTNWLERVTWIPTGKRRGKKRPGTVVYRSFTYGDSAERLTDGILNEETLAFANGVYKGPTRGHNPHGRGIFQYNDESCYEGEFRDGIMEGEGCLTWPDGRIMRGRFRRSVLEGQGECVWSDGSRYIGSFMAGLMHGPGVFFWADGTRFEGLFEKGQRTDQGAWERPGDNASETPRDKGADF